MDGLNGQKHMVPLNVLQKCCIMSPHKVMCWALYNTNATIFCFSKIYYWLLVMEHLSIILQDSHTVNDNNA